MPLPPITRFSSLATSPTPTNKNNGLYAPPLNATQIAAIPANTKVNGGIWYNSSTKNLETVVDSVVEVVQTGPVGHGYVVGPGDSTAGNIAVFSDKTGKLIADSKVGIAQVPNPAPLLRFANGIAESLEAPNLTVNEIGNLGHIKFTNGLGLIFVDGLMPVEFITNTYKTVTQVCSLFTDGLPSSSTSPSALVEIQSDTGALLLSRMTSTERDALSAPSGANGMLLFNTTTNAFNGFDGTNWRALPMLNTNNTLTVADPVSSTNAATKAYVDAAVSGIPSAIITLAGNVTGSGVVTSPITTTLNMTLDQIKAPVANLDLNNKNIINLLDPITAQQAATKNYVDTRTITLTGAVIGSGALGTSIATTLTNINTSQITNFNAAVTAFRLDQFAVPTSNISMGSKQITSLLNPSLAQDAATKNYVDTSISGAGIAPAAAKYIIQTANATLTNAQVLGSLTTGLLKNTTTTGVLTIGVAGTDYYSPGNPTRIIDTTNTTTNFFIGTLAGNLALTGTLNTGIGLTCLQSLTTGTDNTATGTTTLKNNTTGLSNCAFGSRTLSTNVIGSSNSAFGTDSLLNNISSSNSAFGFQTLLTNTTGTNNAAFGYQTLFDNIIGNNNSAFGYQALPNNIADNNAAFGYQTLFDNTSGTLNSAFGYQALQANTSGTLNSAFGCQALQANTTASANCAFGYKNLFSNTTGTNNSAFGNNALSSNTIKSGHSAFGYAALFSNTLGSYNSAYGYNSLYSNIDGDFNAAFSDYALYSNTSGGNNSSFGHNSQYSNTLGGGNSTFGSRALYNNITGSNNSAFGYFAGSNFSDNNKCLFLGNSADASINTLTNAVAIGYLAFVGASNCMVLGGTGTNQLSVGIGLTPNAQLQLPTIHANRKLVLYETANNDHQVIGLGTALNIFRFQVDKNTAASGYTWNAAASTSISTELMRLTGTGFLGLGVPAPHAQLHLDNSVVSRKIILFEGNDNDHEFYGFGINAGALRLQLANIAASYVFYAAASPSTSTELMRLTGAGVLYAKQSYAFHYADGAEFGTSTSGTAGNFVKLSWPSATTTNYSNYTYNASKLTYSGTVSTQAQVIQVSFASYINAAAVNTEVTTYALYRNGALIASIKVTLGINNTSWTNVSFAAGVTNIVTNDYFEVYVAHSTNSKTVHVGTFNITISST